jgi:hypothetical protein
MRVQVGPWAWVGFNLGRINPLGDLGLASPGTVDSPRGLARRVSLGGIDGVTPSVSAYAPAQRRPRTNEDRGGGRAPRAGELVDEAAHATAALTFCRHVDGIRLNPDVDGIEGVCFHGRDPLDLPDASLAGSLLLVDRRVRDLVEQDVVISLSGIVAVELFWNPGSGYRPEPPTAAEVERLTRKLEHAGYVKCLEEFQLTPPLEICTDAENVFQIGAVWARGEHCAPAFIHWMLAETIALVRSREFTRPLAALTDQLLKHGELPGSEVHRVFEKHTHTRNRCRTSQLAAAT